MCTKHIEEHSNIEISEFQTEKQKNTKKQK